VISVASIAAVDAFLADAVKSSLVRNAGDSCHVQREAEVSLRSKPGERVVVITSSAFQFRVLTVMRAGNDPQTRRYYGGAAEDTAIGEAFYEAVNMCCGALNRQLGRHAAHVGLSIPYALDSECSNFLNDLPHDQVLHYAITINQTVMLGATLCMSLYAPVEFAAATDAVECHSGELEMF
jgi:hypothetical protein